MSRACRKGYMNPDESRQIPTEPQPDSDKPVLYAGDLAEYGDISVIDKLSSIIERLLARGDTQKTIALRVLT